jgi:hypothetical protein
MTINRIQSYPVTLLVDKHGVDVEAHSDPPSTLDANPISHFWTDTQSNPNPGA